MVDTAPTLAPAHYSEDEDEDIPMVESPSLETSNWRLSMSPSMEQSLYGQEVRELYLPHTDSLPHTPLSLSLSLCLCLSVCLSLSLSLSLSLCLLSLSHFLPSFSLFVPITLIQPSLTCSKTKQNTSNICKKR